MGINPMPHTTISSWAQAILAMMQERGLDAEQLARQVGLSEQLLNDASARIETARMSRLWQLAEAASNDDCLGIQAARFIKPTTLHALGFAVLVSDNLLDAFQRLARFHRVVSDAVCLSMTTSMTTEEELVVAHLSASNQDFTPSQQAFEMSMAACLYFARQQLDCPLVPLRAAFKRPAPDCLSHHQQVFQCQLLFDQPANRMVFQRCDMLQPIASANAAIARHNDQIVAQYLSQFDQEHYAQRVHQRLIELLPSGDFSIEALAQSFNTSPRSLHRRLQKEGIAYQEILNDVRQNLAEQYLRQADCSITEIAFKLGYTDASNFARAFKRWKGHSPNHYRGLFTY